MSNKTISMEAFKSLTPNKKIEYLQFHRKVASDKEIRDEWGMTKGNYNYYLTSLGLKDIPNPNEEKEERKPYATRKSKDDFIELSYSVVDEEQRQERERAVNPAYLQQPPQLEAPKGATHLIHYPSVTGTVAQLRKRLEVILMLLELDGEDTELTLGITIDRI